MNQHYRKDDLLGKLWPMLSRFFGQTAVKTTMGVLAGALVMFFGQTFVKVPLPGDYATKVEVASVSAFVRTVDNEKLDIAQYEKDCARNRADLDQKADKSQVNEMAKNIDRMLTLQLNPWMADQVRKEVNRERKSRQ